MNDENSKALRKAFQLSFEIDKYLAAGNGELAERLAVAFNSLLLTLIVTELVPGAQEIMDQVEKELEAKIEEMFLGESITKDGTIIQ